MNKRFFIDFQKENNYEEIKPILEGKITKIPKGENDILNIINTLSKNLKEIDNLDNFKFNKNQKNPEIPTPDILLLNNPINSSESFFIYQDFKLIEKNCAKVLLKDIEGIPYDTLKCTFAGNNLVIFHYSKDIYSLNKIYLCVISTIIDEKYNFRNEYLLKYNDKNSYKSHIEVIKKDLSAYLDSVEFVNNIAPIVVNGYIEIGVIIKISEHIPQPPPPPPQKIKSTRKNFPSKPLIGLENIGATCYMNATLQCLCNIEKFADYFKYDERLDEIVRKDIQNKKLCTSFKELIDNLYPELNENKTGFKVKNKNIKIINEGNKDIIRGYYAPREFKNKISRMNPLFEGIQANDAKDLVNFLIMTLHEELNNPPQNQIEESSGNLFEAQRNKQLMFNNFSKNFVKTQQSIISDLFYALNCGVTRCSNCKTCSYNYHIYFFLIFYLEEVRKFKLTKNNLIFNNNKQNEVDIFDCFEFERKVNIMSGDDSMYCNYCKQICASSMCTILATGPEILIIILNRGKGIEFNIKLNFTQTLDISNYIELKETSCQYELIGVITHIGESSMSGHFIAYCKEYWNNTWLKFYDAMVSPVNNFQSEVIDFANPYLLFYKKIHNKNN